MLEIDELGSALVGLARLHGCSFENEAGFEVSVVEGLRGSGFEGLGFWGLGLLGFRA